MKILPDHTSDDINTLSVDQFQDINSRIEAEVIPSQLIRKNLLDAQEIPRQIKNSYLLYSYQLQSVKNLMTAH